MAASSHFHNEKPRANGQAFDEARATVAVFPANNVAAFARNLRRNIGDSFDIADLPSVGSKLDQLDNLTTQWESAKGD